MVRSIVNQEARRLLNDHESLETSLQLEAVWDHEVTLSIMREPPRVWDQIGYSGDLGRMN